MADITHAIPFRLSPAASTSFGDSTAGWDMSIGGLGWLLRPSAQTPYLRASEPVRKQQLDTSGEPGEQSLSSWWTRSQSDWANGAGVTWYEPGSDEFTAGRFYESHGIDPWTPGQFGLLKKMAQVGSPFGQAVHLASGTVSGTAGYVRASGTDCTWVPETGSSISKTLAGGSASKPAVAGRLTYVGHAAGIAQINWVTSTITEPWTHGSAVRCWYVKQRLVVAVGEKLYTIAPGAASGAITTVGTLIFTHPSATWTWTDVAEAGSVILAAGYDDAKSEVISFTIENNGSGVPTLVGGSQVAVMPPGEQIRCMASYLGNVLVLGTTRGVRVGEVAAAGDILYGPLTAETAGAVSDLAFRDRFCYAAVTASLADGNSGAVRIDLSVEVDDAGRRPWAWDVSAGLSNAADSIALVGDRVVLAANWTVFEQSATEFVDTGYLTLGRVRYATVEPKAFRLCRLEASIPTGGTATLTALTPSGGATRVIEFNSTFSTDEDVTVQIAGEQVHQWMQFKMTLTPGTSSLTTPTVTGVSMKAVPVPGKVRLYQFPLSCFDKETTRTGAKKGYPGSAYERVVALEAAEGSAAPVGVKDHRTGEAFIGVIEGVDFAAEHPPDRSSSNFGGTVVVTVRRL